MRPSFNTAGPCFADEHYMLPPERRLGRVLELIEDGKYFSLQAGRQTGKTTSAQWLVRHYNQGAERAAVWIDLETAREEPDLSRAMVTVLNAFDRAIKRTLPSLGVPEGRARFLEDPASAVLVYLQDLAKRSPKPLVILFDEADCLVGATMVSFLTQIREGYIARREEPFPYSIALIGQRAVRDYTLSQEERRAIAWLGTASPFNITAEVTSIGSFTSDEVVELLAQHTAKTGQRFLPEASASIHERSQGHPWLVNALADQIVDRDVRDRSIAITADHVEAAKETIILERRTHIDSLIHKLRDPRVRRILDAMLAGDLLPAILPSDDVAYTLGLGIIRREQGAFVLANPIYREVIPRTLTYEPQYSIHQPTAWYVGPDGSLDMAKMMAAWQTFWRKDGHLAAEGFGYRESGPHLVLMAFLQRIINGGGSTVGARVPQAGPLPPLPRIEREYGLGRGALDLLIEWRGERHAIEVKLRRDTETEEDALEQITRYLDHLGLDRGFLVMFDLRSTLPWAERLTTRVVETAGKRVTIVGC